MSFEDLLEARAKRAARDAAKANRTRGKRGRKRKCGALGPLTKELEVEEQQETTCELSQDKAMSSSANHPEHMHRQGTAPVARMW